MQLNRQTDYALRVLIFLTLKSEDELVKLDEVSKKFNIVKNHLTKIVAKLAKLQYIVTQRGNGGGIKIHPNALNLNLFEIMSEFESSSLYTMIFHIFSSRVVLPNIFRQSLNSFVEKLIFEMALTIISKPYLK